MQIIRPILGPGVYAVEKTTMRTPVGIRPAAQVAAKWSPRAVDFSHVTPRQLQTYANEMIKNGRMTAENGSASTRSLPHEWYDKRSDVAVDISANLHSSMASARNNGSQPLAAFYSGLTDRMKRMEAQSLPVSVVA
jgi:hypothetical protein